LRERKNVTLVESDSVAGVQAWAKWGAGHPADLLFIDGSHTLHGVWRDYQAWVKNLKPGGRIAFHDYDPIERGGIVHPGVQIFIDTLLSSAVLTDVVRVGRILSGVVAEPASAAKAATDLGQTGCLAAWRKRGQHVRDIIDSDFSSWTALGDQALQGPLVTLLMGTRAPRKWAKTEDLMRVANEKVLVVQNPLTENLRREIEKSTQCEFFDEMSACYLLLETLRRDRDHLLASARDRRGFFKASEALEMWEHGTSAPHDLSLIFAEPAGGVEYLSRRIAREHMRLSFLLSLRDSLFRLT
jgi:hypothetical protein